MSQLTRRSWTAGENLRILLTGLDGAVEISELRRRDLKAQGRE